MNDTARTIIAVVVAGGLAGAAIATRPTPISDVRFADVGEVFHPGFTDPTSATSLEIVSFDGATASFEAFKVEFDGKRWVIPSHHGHPADATDKMVEAATAFIGVRKEQVVSDNASDHQALGVLAPDDEAAPLEGRGVKVTIAGEGGRTLASFIIGGPVEGEGTAGKRYVREPGRSRVYIATINADLSPRFADWIETDLLSLRGSSIESLTIDRYTINEKTGLTVDPQRIEARRVAPAAGAEAGAASGAQWTVTSDPGGPPAAGETVDEARLQQVVGALSGLRIVGVRPKPANLAAILGGGSQGGELGQLDVLNLQSRGFYLSQDGRLMANEGQVSAVTNDGVRYTIWFGEIVPGEGKALSAGSAEEASAASGDGAAPSGEARYAFITVSFDESAHPMPERPAELADEGTASAGAPPPDSDAAQANPEAMTRRQAAQLAYDRLVEQRDERMEEARKKVGALARRFADWYYVIDGAAFDTLRPGRSDLIVPAGGGPAEDGPVGPAPEGS